jgi:ABC-type bacteriocin/lantibiotic exporter with double-glycine peptidase domain
LSILIQFLSTFVAGFVIGFAKDYRLTLFLVAFTPLLAISGAAFTQISSIFTSQEQKQYASAGAVAEEVLSSIRTVYAFSGENQAAARYISWEIWSLKINAVGLADY